MRDNTTRVDQYDSVFQALDDCLGLVFLINEPVDVEAETGRALAAGLAAQTCIDVELIARFDGRWPSQSEVPQVRRIPPALAASPLDVLRQARSILRGRFVAVTSETGSALLADPAFVEKVLRRFATSDDELDAIAFVDAGADGRFSFRALSPEDGDPDAVPHTVVWRMEAEKELPWGLHADPDDPVPSIVRLLSGGGAQVEWRHVPTAGSRRPDPAKDVATPPPDSSRWHHLASENGDRPAAEPLLPGTGRYRVPRWEASSWMPALSTLVIRYRERYGDRRVVISGPPPTGFVPEWILGAIRCTSLEGTARVVRINGDYTALPRGEWNSAPADADEIGYAELARLPQMDILALASHRTTGQRTLVAIPDDPLLSEVDVIRTLGHLEPCPARPREIPETQRPDGLLGLVKTVDHRARRHRYAVGSVPEGEPIGELGALAESELQGSIAVWIVDGFLVTERHRPAVGRPGLLAAARWALEPAAWGGLASLLSRARVLVRRSAVSATRLAKPRRPVAQPGGKPVGWLYDTARPGHTPLYASYHPVNGDQLLTRSPEDAAQMGYGPPELVGFLRLAAPVTGDLDQRPLAVPWARRFGAVPRSG